MKFRLLTVVLLLAIVVGAASAEQAMKLKAIRQVQAGDMDVLQARWSPDGSSLALTGVKHAGIYLMNPSTGEITTITDEASAGYRLAWSDDGRFIAYKAVVGHQAVEKVVKLADLRTGEIRQLSAVSTDVGLPTWFPDGRIGYTYQGNFLIVDQEGTITQTIPDIASNVATVSFDGQWILYNDGQDRIWAYHLTGGQRLQVTPDGRRFFNPVWSSTEAVAVVNELGGPFHLVDVANGAMTALDDGNHYAWSPDGEHIIYDITEDDGHYITAADLYLIGKDGTGRRALTTTVDGLEMFPSWSAQGKLAFSRPDGKLFMAQLVTE